MSSRATNASGSGEVTIKSIMLPLMAIIVGMFMVILDGTAMNVAINQFMVDFESTFSLVQWTITGYALAQAAVIPLAGWLSDRFGAKRVFLTSVILFTIGSVLCAFAATVEQLIIYRILQGLGGGMVAPIAMAFTYRLSPPGKQGAVMGMIGIPMLLAPALGPVVGGYLVDFATWHWIFLINLPIGIIAVIIGIKTLPNLERQTVPTLDILGIILAPLAFAMLAYGISSAGGEHGSGSGWTSPATLTGLIVGGVALILFIIVELRRRQPLLELRVFKSSDFTRGIILQWITQIALFGTIFLIPIFLIGVKGYSAFDTGLILLPQALAAGIFMPIGGKLFDKFGARPVVIFGLLLVSIGAYLLSHISATTTIPEIMVPLVLLGSGMGFSMMPINTHIIQSAPKELVGRVTSLTGAAQQVMTSFAIAGLSTLLASRVKHYTVASPGPNIPYLSYGDAFLVLSIIGVFGIAVALLLRKPKQQEGTSPSGEKSDMSVMMSH
ncbi:DHA2 family efflux MFS transporter permease subunit [Paenibacillus sp. GSMTC-2017]|uniref:DHA2 family efflux MFS transporter permease subunit n=1 Tax=Paenibacillus sp. GSMTC-2017 TaxID=2794350 RepID=UPI0018D680F9|nr:DHA2 family efflux MFS transporter permease subunit [Paenibacillus sp. GSMTC-2017]MBH5316555.1 DHA2 family efflux MFS transporter permease subunit [Paenibacillus sp. GSMTC-2017]